jgi:rRNA maturation RNase YbeY
MKLRVTYSTKVSPIVSSIVDFVASHDFGNQVIPYDTKDLLSDFPYIDISIVNATQIHSLNKQYREKDKATDVLSFELQQEKILGELYICPKEVEANAEHFNATIDQEWVDVLVHGILHLLGYDHSDKMFEAQEKIKQYLLNKYETRNISR